MKSFLLSIFRKIPYIIAAFIIFAAIVICIGRGMTPILDQHKEDLQKLASDALHAPVLIKDVRMSWYQYHPVINLNEVTILDPNTQKPTIKIHKISVLLSIPESIWQWKPVTAGFLISGTQISVIETEGGTYEIPGFPKLEALNEHEQQSDHKLLGAIGWLSSQPRLILQNIEIAFTSFKAKKEDITLHELNVWNSQDTHKISINAKLNQKLPTEGLVTIEWKGEHLDLNKIKAKIYVNVSGFVLNDWLGNYSWKGWHIKDGRMNAKIWATWKKGGLRKFQSTFQTYRLTLYADANKSTHIINRFHGDIGWKKIKGIEVFAGDDILIDLPTHLWPTTNFSLSFGRDANENLIPQSLRIGYLNLADVVSYLQGVPEMPSEVMTQLSALQLKGSLQNTVIQFPKSLDHWQQSSIATSFKNLTFLPQKNFPGVAHLTGAINWNGTQGELKLDSDHANITIPALFNKTEEDITLSGDVLFKKNPQNEWMVSTTLLQLLNKDLAANVKGNIALTNQDDPKLDLHINLALHEAKKLAHYLPNKILDPDVSKWLKEAFLSGEITSSEIIIQGNLKDFPFDHQNGLFSVTTKINNVDLHFAPDWPLLRQIKGSVIFSGRKMEINIDQALLKDIPVANITGVIPYLGADQKQILEIAVNNTSVNLSALLHYVHHSPLEKTLGKMFDGIEMEGQSELNLGLTIPLAHPDDAKVKGDITVRSAEMNLVPWNLTLSQINGTIHFTENTVHANTITASLFNNPVQFNIATLVKNKDASILKIAFNNKLNVEDLEKWLKYPISKVAKGSTNVEGQINFSLNEPMALTLNSKLVGVSVDLPSPYAKKENVPIPFILNLFAKEKEPLRIKVQYGSSLGAAAVLERKGEQYELLSANLHLGAGDPAWPPEKGIFITGEIDELDLDKLPDTKSTSLSLDTLRQINLLVKKINFAGQVLKLVNLKISPMGPNWHIYISNADIQGELQIPMKLSRQSMVIGQFEKINWKNSNTDAHSGMNISVKSLPGISVIAKNVVYNNLTFGQIIFKATPSLNGLTIENLRIDSPYLNLKAKGDWTEIIKFNQTHLEGEAHTENVSKLLSSFNMDIKNFIASRGALQFNLTWNDAVYAPNLATLTGTANLDIGKGRIVELGEGNDAKMDLGKMLSVFSLQTIPRRLSFDFSDLFQKGYGFDSMTGDFTLQKGDVFTKNFQFKGPVASVGIDGRIGMKNKDYDFKLTVIANVTSSIPVAATLLTGNPLIGLGALAVNSVIGSKVTTSHYIVKGPWSNPTWKAAP